MAVLLRAFDLVMLWAGEVGRAGDDVNINGEGAKKKKGIDYTVRGVDQNGGILYKVGLG